MRNVMIRDRVVSSLARTVVYSVLHLSIDPDMLDSDWCVPVWGRGRESEGEVRNLPLRPELCWRRVWCCPVPAVVRSVVPSVVPLYWLYRLDCNNHRLATTAWPWQFLEPARLSMFVPALARDRKLAQPSSLPVEINIKLYSGENIFSGKYSQFGTLKSSGCWWWLVGGAGSFLISGRLL